MSEERVRVLIKQRSTVKASLTRIKNYLENVSTDIDRANLIVRNEQLGNLFDKFNSIHDELGVIDEELATDDILGQFEDEYYSVKATLTKLLGKGENSTRSQLPVADSIPNCSSSDPIPQVILPRLNLPLYGGNIEEWPSFSQLFKSIIHDNQSIPNIQKLYYLKSCLKDEAHQLLQSLPSTDQNYLEAWEILNLRYNNKRLIINSHLKGLFNQATLHNESSQGLRRLLDETENHTRALKSLGESVEYWDSIIIHTVSTKLDNETRKQWEMSLKTNKIPTFEDLKSFLIQRINALQSSSKTVKPNYFANNQCIRGMQNKGSSSHYTSSKSSLNNHPCVICEKENHTLNQCDKFNKMSVSDRIDHVKRLKLCFNCLKPNHSATDCYSSSCKTCNKKHHTLIHIEQKKDSDNLSGNVKCKSSNHTSEVESNSELVSPKTNINLVPKVLLSTAVVLVENSKNKLVSVRALLDSGAQSNFITKSCAEKLELETFNLSMNINGIGKSKTTASRGVRIKLKSRVSDFSTNLSAIILPKITTKLPTERVDCAEFSHYISNLVLADPEFFKPDDIDLLIGAEMFFDLLVEGKIGGKEQSPCLQNSVFGWIISGKCGQKLNECQSTCNLSIDDQLKRFWEIEEVNDFQTIYSKEEQLCEQHFKNNVKRDETGRFIVKLPFNDRLNELGDSKQKALMSFNRTEQRLFYNYERKQQYNDFLKEYLILDHMECVGNLNDTGLVKPQNEYFLPHHEVIKESSTTTKLRVVFNASCPTSTRVSLNDTLMVGPTVQQDLFSIITRFRQYNVVMVADIEKMYRQILVDEEDRKYQQILWRENRGEPVKVFRLKTVTYGTSCAPYLATRCLKQLAEDETGRFASACAKASTDFYVDDLLTGSHDLESAISLQEELNKLLSAGGFKLRKWCSNNPHVLENIPTEDRESSPFNLELCDSQSIKTLGIVWEPKTDNFKVNINITEDNPEFLTKREILREISRIFDPLGLISPLVIIPKILIQRLWLTRLAWDESLGKEICNQWSEIKGELLTLNQFCIPRQVTCNNYDKENIELVGFCDASEKAYAACVYVRSISSNNEVSVNLLCSKTRVAPIKQISLPRLELCGALLVSKLLNKTSFALNIEINKCYVWTDSTIVLCWLSQLPNKWKTFVANRVAEIQDIIPPSNWNHVSSRENPADLASRGIPGSELKQSNLWWHGPEWLQHSKDCWPRNTSVQEDCNITSVPEFRKHSTQVYVSSDKSTLLKRLINFSSFVKVTMIVAFILRFINNTQRKPEERKKSWLSGNEIENAVKKIVKLIQEECFVEDINNIKKHGYVKNKSKLKPLFPFLDEEGLLRVGGRLENANVSFELKHQLLLPAKHYFTTLLIQYEHMKHFHAGVQLIQNVIRQKFWIVNIKNEIKSVIRKCTTCIRYKSSPSFNIMGNLPSHRVNAGRAFVTTGIDFAGPLLTKRMGARVKVVLKSYVSLFVCMTTKAIHIELVSDLTANAFLSAFKRFVSRRGLPSHIYTDNATNFKGVYNHFHKMILHSESVKNYVQERQINWHFIPPSSPNFGGLWESAIKSMKTHLTRVIGDQVLNFEELSTLLIQIEACLNSRPLSPMSNDPRDLNVITPGHFLIFAPLTAVPERDVTSEKLSLTKRWTLVEQLHQHFWKRWSVEYLHNLQQRRKWKEVKENFKIGDMVIIKEDNIPPCKWNIGRVEQVHPGSDNIVRVVTLRSSSGLIKRPITKLIFLPTN